MWLSLILTDNIEQKWLEEIWKLKKRLEEMEHPEIVIVSGNRRIRADPFHRKIISKTFQKLNGIMFDLSPMEDITSPYKLTHSLAKRIASECKFMKDAIRRYVS